MNSANLGNPGLVPLYRCTDCGFVTTASEANATATHEQGSPACDGEIELIADFKSAPAVVLPSGRRRRRAAASNPDHGTAPSPQ